MSKVLVVDDSFHFLKSVYSAALSSMSEQCLDEEILRSLKPMKNNPGKDVALITGGTFKKSMREPGRNECCPCGSGKKFKKCCLDTGYSTIRNAVIAVSKRNKEAGL